MLNIQACPVASLPPTWKTVQGTAEADAGSAGAARIADARTAAARSRVRRGPGCFISVFLSQVVLR
jgi:hypothetical protein